MINSVDDYIEICWVQNPTSALDKNLKRLKNSQIGRYTSIPTPIKYENILKMADLAITCDD